MRVTSLKALVLTSATVLTFAAKANEGIDIKSLETLQKINQEIKKSNEYNLENNVSLKDINMSLKYIMTTLNTMQAKIDDLSQNQNKNINITTQKQPHPINKIVTNGGGN